MTAGSVPLNLCSVNLNLSLAEAFLPDAKRKARRIKASLRSKYCGLLCHDNCRITRRQNTIAGFHNTEVMTGRSMAGSYCHEAWTDQFAGIRGSRSGG